PREIEVAARDRQFVALGYGLSDDLSRGRDNATSARQLASLLDSGLRHTDHERAVLISARLQYQVIMKAGEMIVHRHPWHVCRRVVTKHHHLDPLQAHHPVGLRPSAIVADAHPDDSIERAPRAKPQVAHVEIALLEMLE